MTAREFQEWMELYKQEPWGDDWLQASTIAAVTEAVWSKRSFRRDKFVPRHKSSGGPHADDPQLIEARMQRFAEMHNARIEREEQQRKAARAAAPPQKQVRTHIPIPKQKKGAQKKSP